MLAAREGGQPKYKKKEGGTLTKLNHVNHINHICSQRPRDNEGSKNPKKERQDPNKSESRQSHETLIL